MAKIGILGAGTWGVALARMLTNCGNDVVVWSALPEEIDSLSCTRKHPNLKGMVIPDATRFTKALRDACTEKDILLFAVPSVFVRTTARSAAPYIPDGQIIVDVAKGIEPNTLMTMTQIIRDELDKAGGRENVKLVALSGPTHAEEVALDLPTTIVSACTDLQAAELVQDVFMNTCLRVYTNPDVEGVELCGAVKNIIALAAGISAGLGYGDNTKAALITFAGLAGIGDLIVTATSAHSRNNRCGYLIGRGKRPEEAVREVGMVVEGINAIPATLALAERYGVDMPIACAVDAVINHGLDPGDAVRGLMTREKKSESDSFLWK